LEKQVARYVLDLFQTLARHQQDHPDMTETITDLLRTFILLFENVQSPTSVYTLLSKNYVNEVILWGRSMVWEEEGLAYFVTLLKTLSLRLDATTLPLFFNEVSL
jgi:hypothetical protein